MSAPGCTCTCRRPSSSRRAAQLSLSRASGTNPSGKAGPNTSSRAWPEAWMRNSVVNSPGMSSRNMRNTSRSTLSASIAVAAPRPSVSSLPERCNGATGLPSTTSATSATEVGTCKVCGRSDQAMRARSSCSPTPSHTFGPPRSTTGTALPSTPTCCGQCSWLPGKGTQPSTSTCQRWLIDAPFASASMRSTPGQAQMKSAGAWPWLPASKGQARNSWPLSTQPRQASRSTGMAGAAAWLSPAIVIASNRISPRMSNSLQACSILVQRQRSLDGVAGRCAQCVTRRQACSRQARMKPVRKNR